MARDGIERRGVPLGLLANVEPHHVQAKAVDAANEVEEAAARNDALAGILERCFREHERVEQALHGFKLRFWGRPTLELRLDGLERVGEEAPVASKERAVGLARRAGCLLERCRCGVHRELLAKLVDLIVKKLGGCPAAHANGLFGYLGGHVGIPVTVPSDPRAEDDGCSIDGQALARVLDQRTVEPAKVAWHGIPK